MEEGECRTLINPDLGVLLANVVTYHLKVLNCRHDDLSAVRKPDIIGLLVTTYPLCRQAGRDHPIDPAPHLGKLFVFPSKDDPIPVGSVLLGPAELPSPQAI
jgi:hypothetical protein